MTVPTNIAFIGIGAPRCGTSWIANVLRAHPQLCISEPKEVRYFNRHEMQAGRLKGNLNANFDKDISWYLRRFSHAKNEQLCGEFSPIYLSDTVAPEAIKDQYPGVKLIVCLRNPVDRAYSLFKMHRGNSIIEQMSFEQALEKESVYVETGLYGKHMARYLEYFSKDQILLLIFEDLIREPTRELNRIFSFLGVEPPVNLDPSAYHTNESATRRSKKLHKIAFQFSKWLIEHGMSRGLEILRAAGAHKLFNKVNAAPVKRETMQQTTRARLEAEFRDDIVELEGLFDIDLSQWK
jgi:hypothetical protein